MIARASATDGATGSAPCPCTARATRCDASTCGALQPPGISAWPRVVAGREGKRHGRLIRTE